MTASGGLLIHCQPRQIIVNYGIAEGGAKEGEREEGVKENSQSCPSLSRQTGQPALHQLSEGVSSGSWRLQHPGRAFLPHDQPRPL